MEDSLSQDDPFGEEAFAEVPAVAVPEEKRAPAAPAKQPEPSVEDDFKASFTIPSITPQPVPAPAPTPTPAPTSPPPAAPAQTYQIPDLHNTDSDTESTIISKSAIITGELTVTGDIHMFGRIKGNLTASGNLEIAGKVVGNVSGTDVELNHCELKGDINASGFVYMDKESIMIGNLSAQDITLDGKVKGDVTASHKVYVRSNAVVVGNVRAGIIAIDEGAALQGQVIITNNNTDSLDIQEEGTAE